MPETQIPQGFRALGLRLSILEKLDRLGFVTPTEIQQAAIPVALEGHDVMGIAQTGTGKTLAFGLPMADRLQKGQVGLVLAPTRELAQQIEETLRKLGLRTALLIGGAPMGRQISQLRAQLDIIVATPGRLEDHLSQRTADLRRVAIVVLDEADRMLDMGFAPAIRRILGQVSRDRQTMLFSATMPKSIEELGGQYMNNPQRVEVATQGTTAERIDQELIVLQQEDKPEFLRELLYQHKGTILVFSKTRHGARKLAKSIRLDGHSAAELHSDCTLGQRRAALQGFKTGQFRVLVATDIAARGIDVKDIALVINYDVPANPEDYVHRIGRTGRAGASGKAIMLATPDQHRDVRDIEKLIQAELPLSPMSKMSMDRPRNTGSRPSARTGSGGWIGGSNGGGRPRSYGGGSSNGNSSGGNGAGGGYSRRNRN